MNIFNFLRSPDVAAHCEKIKHEFTPLEMAVVISLSHKSIEEKHAGYQWIIDNCSDSPVRDYNCFDARESLHDFLRERIAWERERLADYHAADKEVVFRPYLYKGYHNRDDEDLR